MQVSDGNLMGQAARGDGDALTHLLKRHGPVVRMRLAGQIPRRWRPVLSVDDVMQQTYIDAFVDLDRFVPNGRGSFPAWLHSLAKCNLIDALRTLEAEKRGNNHRRIEPRTREDSFTALHEWIGETCSTPSRHAARDEACATLQWAVQQLPETYLQVVEMYDLQDRPINDVARKLNRSPGAVFMIRARAHRRLREIMGHASHYLTHK